MRSYKYGAKLVFVFLISIMLTSCSIENDGKMSSSGASDSSSTSSPCVTGNINLADFLMINDVMYSLNDSRSDATPIEPELMGTRLVKLNLQ